MTIMPRPGKEEEIRRKNIEEADLTEGISLPSFCSVFGQIAAFDNTSEASESLCLVTLGYLKVPFRPLPLCIVFFALTELLAAAPAEAMSFVAAMRCRIRSCLWWAMRCRRIMRKGGGRAFLLARGCKVL